jgi:hypothetical protein
MPCRLQGSGLSKYVPQTIVIDILVCSKLHRRMLEHGNTVEIPQVSRTVYTADSVVGR